MLYIYISTFTEDELIVYEAIIRCEQYLELTLESSRGGKGGRLKVL